MGTRGWAVAATLVLAGCSSAEAKVDAAAAVVCELDELEEPIVDMSQLHDLHRPLERALRSAGSPGVWLEADLKPWDPRREALNSADTLMGQAKADGLFAAEDVREPESLRAKVVEACASLDS